MVSHDPWEPTVSLPTHASKRFKQDSPKVVSKKSSNLKTKSIMIDEEQENCQASVALLDSYDSALDTDSSMPSIFASLEQQLVNSHMNSRLRQLSSSTFKSEETPLLGSVKDLSNLLKDAEDSRFFEEMTYILEGLRDPSLQLIS
jgi:hypothetical protein